MKKLERIRAAFAKVLLAFSEISTDKGILAWHTEEDLKEGDEVFVVAEDGTETPAEDGEYATEDGKVISVAEGKVASIKDPEAEVAPEEAPAAEEAMEDEVPAIEEPAVEEPAIEDEIISKLEAIMARIAALEERIAKLEEAPAAEPVAEEFKKAVESKSTGNSKNDFYCELAKAGRKE